METINLAGCIILDDTDRLLLIHRKDPDQWEIPGGKVELGEPLIVTAIRELKEELGIDVVVAGLLGYEEFTESERRMIYNWFSARINVGSPQVGEDCHDEFGYFSWEELAGMDNLSANTRNFLAQFSSADKL